MRLEKARGSGAAAREGERGTKLKEGGGGNPILGKSQIKSHYKCGEGDKTSWNLRKKYLKLGPTMRTEEEGVGPDRVAMFDRVRLLVALILKIN